MVFNSFNFLVFILPVLFLYWFIFKKNKVFQNVLLLISSLFFYAWGDWRFLILLILSIFINYYLGLKIYNTGQEKIQRRYLYLGLIFNIGLLVYFKYFNFFYEGFIDMLNIFGTNANYNTLKILLPLGISFFTFQTLGYLIDVYNQEVKPSTNLLEFSVFVSYFPKILSGPIERANNLLPQLNIKRDFSYELSVHGLRQILWGLFAKVVLANNCAIIVNPIFENYQNESQLTLFVGAFFYMIQLYCDFSGYSNMAIGISKLFGIQLMRNFATPFFSTNISDFWRKWHISLTTWMMDYVFTPLSFSLRKYNKNGLIVSIIATFILVGFWHGANWTFIVYGFLHGIYFIPIVYSGGINKSSVLAKGKIFPSIKELFKMTTLFFLVMFTAVIFKAKDLHEAYNYLFLTVSNPNIIDLKLTVIHSYHFVAMVLLILFFFFIEWVNREKEHDFNFDNLRKPWRWALYYFVIILIASFSESSQSFIYFQF